MNQKRQASRRQSTKNACFVDAMSTSTLRGRKLTKTLGSSEFRGVFPQFLTFFVKSPEKVSKMAAIIVLSTIIPIITPPASKWQPADRSAIKRFCILSHVCACEDLYFSSLLISVDSIIKD
jgi:hypothetical protein